MEKSPNQKPISEILPDLFKNGFILYCGAGISIPAPSCAPSWWTLTEEILNAFFNRVPNDWGLPKDLIIKDPDKKPEEVFENFAHMLDIRLYKIFKALDVTEQNGNHQIIAKLAKLGVLKGCITTNFDIFIERALKAEGVPFDLLVENNEYSNFYKKYKQNPSISRFVLCKIHGTIERPNSIVSIASAYKSSKGFSIPKADLITAMLSTYPVLFLGYSGFDFEHLNYRRFWERTGPVVKGIYWNQRLGEKSIVDFKDIFQTCWNRFQFTLGDLPKDLISGLTSLAMPNLNLKDIKTVDPSLYSTLLQKAVKERSIFFNTWVNEIPEPFLIGLVLSESNQFSQRYKEMMKDYKDISEDKDTISYGGMIDMQDLVAKMQRGEISQEQYMVAMNDYMLQMRLMYLRNSWKPQIFEMIKQNKYPGITDDQMKRDQWLGYLAAFGNYKIQEAVQIAIDLMARYNEAYLKDDPVSKLEMQIVTFLPQMMHPKKELWEPYYNKMLAVKTNLTAQQIDFDTGMKQLTDIFNLYNNDKLGMTIDLRKLFDKLLKTISESDTYEHLLEGCEALVLTINYVGMYIYTEMMKEEAFSKKYQEVVMAIYNKQTLTADQINEIYLPFRNMFNDVLKTAEKYDKKLPKIMIEASILRFWATSIQYIDSNQMQSYTKYWDAGEYAFKFTNPDLYAFTKEKIIGWIDPAMKDLPPRFMQNVLGYMVAFAESGNDFELVQKLTLKSLELSEGIVTEATPMEIPSSLAGFYEARGDKTNALKYYILALDAIKSMVPPLYQDIIIYRAALLTADLGNYSPDSMKQAMKIIGQYHPEFRGNAGMLKMPARDKCLAFANDLAKKLNYPNAKEAVKNMLSV